MNSSAKSEGPTFKSLLSTSGGSVSMSLSNLLTATWITRTRSDTTCKLLASTRNSFFNSSARRQIASVRVRSENSNAKILNSSYPHEP